MSVRQKKAILERTSTYRLYNEGNVSMVSCE